jgi:hypothetical protein
MPFLKGIYATKIIPDKWWESPEIDDITTLRPQPKKDALLIVGDASGVIDDINNFLDFKVEFDTMCINYSAELIPWPIQHFIAGDSHMADMQAVAASLKNGCIKHCWNPNSKNFDVRWVRNSSQGWNGTTANLGIRIGLILGYLRIVLAGVPMDNSGNWYQRNIPADDVKQGKDHRAHLWKWTEIATRPIARFIKSMSGNTADMFGKPTYNWLTFNHKEIKNADTSRD